MQTRYKKYNIKLSEFGDINKSINEKGANDFFTADKLYIAEAWWSEDLLEIKIKCDYRYGILLNDEILFLRDFDIVDRRVLVEKIDHVI